MADPDGVAYGARGGRALASRGQPHTVPRAPGRCRAAHPSAARGRGLATRLAVRIIRDALPTAGIVRYRALNTNAPSLAIARSLGFAGYGQNLVARLGG